MNYSDAERATSLLREAGYQAAPEAEADIILVFACSVRQKAIDRIYGKVKGWNKKRRRNPQFKTILSGCVLPQDKKGLSSSFDLIFEIKDLHLLRKFLAPKTIVDDCKDYFNIPPLSKSSFRAYVPIMTGCDNFCSYCAVPYTRGREVSRSQEEVVRECRELIARGYREITLLGQNVNSYKFGFPELLKQIDALRGNFRIYFYSNHPKDFSKELLQLLPNLKHFPPYIHLPLQSGSNEILRKMNRHYTAEEYLALVDRIRESLPQVTLTTDIIVGYPEEGEEEFEDTLEVVKKARFEMIFVGQYSPRPGTVSAKVKDNVSSETKKIREKILTETTKNYLSQKNQELVGHKLEILIDEEKSGNYFGRTAGYKVVEIKTDQPLEIGQFYEAKIIEAEPWKLAGEIILAD